MCKDHALPPPQLVPLSEAVGAQQLAGCKTAADLLARKPDLGVVTAGGNPVGLQHSLADKTNLTAIVKAQYVAKVCFVGSSRDAKMSETLCLPREATVDDLKRSFFARHKGRAIAAAISASGLQGASDEEQLDAIFCRDVDGRFLADKDRLPAATSTACSDVGYHAQFFLDVMPQSMRRIPVKEKIKESDAAIDSFVKTPRTLGAWPDQPHEYPQEWAAMRQGLNERLAKVAKEVPEAVRHDPLQDASAAFSATMKSIEDSYDEECSSNMPLAFRRCADELADAIATKNFDSLETTLPTEAASRLMAMHPFVEELARIQTSSEWTNYDTETDHPDGLTLGDIATELLDRKESVRLHVSVRVCMN